MGSDLRNLSYCGHAFFSLAAARFIKRALMVQDKWCRIWFILCRGLIYQAHLLKYINDL